MFKKIFENVIKPKNNFFGKAMVKGMNQGHEKLADRGRSYLNIKPYDTILDIGCGGGRNVQYFLTKAKKVCGIDYSEMSVSVSKELNEKEIKNGRCEIIQADVAKLPFADESFDIVTAFETIYFREDIETAFEEINRVLVNDGIFLICNEGSDRENPNIKKRADMLKFKVYNGNELVEKLQRHKFKSEYHLNKKTEIALIATKIKKLT